MQQRIMRRIRITALLFMVASLCSQSYAQVLVAKGWHLKDKTDDHVYGISLQKAYDFLKANSYKKNPVIVAVIDLGTDTTHEDLKNVLWKNKGEIADNGKDDDGNGYIDDVFGWNFLGNKERKPNDLDETQWVYEKYKTKWQSFDSTRVARLSAKERYGYTMWKRAAKEIRRPVYLSADAVKSLQLQQKDEHQKIGTSQLKDLDLKDRYYGNGDVMAKDPMHGHGTHVAGLIAAQRNNGIGMDGVADDVRLMTLKAVSDDPESDKHIALAIRYAVNMGARVINMSFVKSVSPGKKWVDEAIKFAAEHDVLIVHGAGNESKNMDEFTLYPSDTSISGSYVAPNFINVGAITMKGAVALFSDYGKKTVDVFAPGVQVYSTYPLKNKYQLQDGTSMAAPIVAGIAALIREYFPGLSARQVKYAIEHSVLKSEEKMKIPGAVFGTEKVTLSELCTSGGIVNACEAIKLASTLKGELKKTTYK
jgi:subtilisin family serine protease